MPAFTRQSATDATASSARRTPKSPHQTRRRKSPDRLLRSLRRGELYGFSAAACARLVRIVEDKLGRQLFGLVIHLGPEQEQHRLWIDQDLDAPVLDHLVGRIDGVGILHCVFHSRAAAV